MKREERKKEENKSLKDWKKPEFKVLDKKKTQGFYQQGGGTEAHNYDTYSV